jgi:hypothetical protein
MMNQCVYLCALLIQITECYCRLSNCNALIYTLTETRGTPETLVVAHRLRTLA